MSNGPRGGAIRPPGHLDPFLRAGRVLTRAWRVHEYRFVLGFGISSLGVAFGGAVRSAFVTRFGFVSEMLPAVAYVLVLAVGLSAVLQCLSTLSSREGRD